MLTEEAFQGWKADPVTQDYYKLLREWRAALMEQWAAGQFNSDEPTVTHAANCGAVGEVRLLQKLLELDLEQFEEGLNGPGSEEAEQIGLEAIRSGGASSSL